MKRTRDLVEELKLSEGRAEDLAAALDQIESMIASSFDLWGDGMDLTTATMLLCRTSEIAQDALDPVDS